MSTAPRPLLAAALLAACATAEEAPATASAPEWVGPEDTAPPVDTAPPEEEESEPPEEVGGPGWEPELQVDEIGAQELDTDWLFDLEVIHEVDISLSEAARDSLLNDPYEWAEADVVIDGIPVETVGIRIRGKIGSYRTLNQKPKFKLDFGEFVDGQTFYGLEHLALNNSVVDCSYLKEHLAFAAFRAAGVAAPRTAPAWVTIDGEDYGLYVLLEYPSRPFLERHYEDPTGNLYDGKYVVTGPGSYFMVDFNEGVDHYFELEEGTDVDGDDITEISRALRDHGGTADYYAELGELVDWDQFFREQLVEQLVGQNDGYGLNRNNYRVYFDPSDGKADFIPWDMDYSFLQDYQWGLSWTSPRGNIAELCAADSTCRAAQAAVAGDVLQDFQDADLGGLYRDLAALTEAEARSDPKRECGVSSVDSYRSIVRGFLTDRPGYFSDFWGL